MIISTMCRFIDDDKNNDNDHDHHDIYDDNDSDEINHNNNKDDDFHLEAWQSRNSDSLVGSDDRLLGRDHLTMIILIMVMIAVVLMMIKTKAMITIMMIMISAEEKYLPSSRNIRNWKEASTKKKSVLTISPLPLSPSKISSCCY